MTTSIVKRSYLLGYSLIGQRGYFSGLSLSNMQNANRNGMGKEAASRLRY